jgi:enterochelin esterase-like enzyme
MWRNFLVSSLPKPSQKSTKSNLSLLIIMLVVLSLVCQFFSSSTTQAAHITESNNNINLSASNDPVDLSTPRRLMTLPDNIVKLSLASSTGTMLALAQVAPDQQLRLFSSDDGGITWNYKQQRNANPLSTIDSSQTNFGLVSAPYNKQLIFASSDTNLNSSSDSGRTWLKFNEDLPGGTSVAHFMDVAQPDQNSALKVWVAGGTQLWAYTVNPNDGSLLQTDKYSLPTTYITPISALRVNSGNQHQIFVGSGQDLLILNDVKPETWQTFKHFSETSNIESLAVYNDETWVGLNNAGSGILYGYGLPAFNGNWIALSNMLEFDKQFGTTVPPIKQIQIVPNSSLVAIVTSVLDNGENNVYFASDAIHFHALRGYSTTTPLSLALRTDGQVLLGTKGNGLLSTAPEAPLLPGLTLPPPNPLFPQNNKPNADYYQETGHYIAEPFRSYWQAHGGLSVFGFPITEAFDEINTEDGQVYQTQYFERARFEYHPENTDPANQVLLGLLGKINLPTVAPTTPISPTQTPDGGRFFAATGHSLAEPFLSYWQNSGGLALFGYPISEPFQELNPDDGKSYLVQYFERNRFEYHPENFGTPYAVLLGLLGKQIANQRQVLPANLGLVAVSGKTEIPGGQQGKIYDQVLHSPILNRDEPYRIYLPPDYTSNTQKRYPVLYMLHGYSGSRVEWFNLGLFTVADNLIAQGQISPMIIVLPTGDQEYWVDHANNGPKWGTYVAQDVVNFIDQNYRTKADRQDRAIGGLSMGGQGALQIGLNFSSIFGIISGTSSTLRDHTTTPSYFGDDNWFAAHDPVSLANSLDPSVLNSLKIWIDIGVDDQDWVARNQILHGMLASRNISHDWHLQPGGHTAEYWIADVPLLLKWYASQFGT